MKSFSEVMFRLGILILLLILSPFLFIFAVNTLFGIGISHGFYEYLAVWALVIIIRGATT